ncbi:hypothetical protein Tco_1140923 [Tanacetum coccineum]
MRYGLLRMLRRRQSLLTPNIPNAKLLHVRTVHWNSWGDEGYLREDSPGGTSAPAGQAQGGPSPAFMKENIDVLRTMIKELDNRGQEKVTPRKLFNEVSGRAGSENSQMGPSAEEAEGYSSDGSSRSKSRVRASRRNSSSDSGYDTVSDSGSEDLSMPYRRPKPMPFTSRITRFIYHRRANVQVYEVLGNRL